ncbi:sulfite exporter TauE/SafE family protein [candidate division WOR-3 bacterium]|nr:sulfite exporter TauE/SafE family protein [candidate division WOR-3 bacterium]
MPSNSLKLLAAGFTMGWGPCLAYTAPLLLPYIGATQKSWKGGLKIGLAFSIGRLLALGILGGIATVAFSFINRLFPPQKSGWLYLILALFIIITGILIILGKGFKIHIGKSILAKGTGGMFLFGFLMGIAPCAPYVAVLTYIACIAENVVLEGVLYAIIFAIGTAVAPIVLGTLMGVIPEKLFKRDKWLKVFQVICGIILILFGSQLIYYVLNLVI